MKSNTGYYLILAATALIFGCSEKNTETEAVARVNNSLLFEDELNIPGDSINYKKFDRNEFIRNWINNELLYQQAVKEGLTETDEYKRLVEASNKEIAKTLFVNNFLSAKIDAVSEKELEEHYSEHQAVFQTYIDTYLINQAIFYSEDKAIQFRNTLIESDWNKSSKILEQNSDVISVQSSFYLSEYKFLTGRLSRIAREMIKGEVSPVIHLEDGTFGVVQLIDKFPKGDTPPFSVIVSEVKQSYLIKKKNEILSEYIKQLYNENDIEIKK